MKLEDHILESPKKISGSHFGDFLICKRRAWFNLYAQKDIKAPDPSYLKNLQYDGKKYEKEVYSQKPFDSAKSIKSYRDAQKRVVETIESINSGYDFILQAYFVTDDYVGVADVLQRVNDSSCDLGYYYCVGDIKYSKEVSTAYVFQIMFYSTLLSLNQNYKPQFGFIILGNGSRVEIDFQEYYQHYDSTFNQLIKLRNYSLHEIEQAEPAVLIPACASCAYRYICLKSIISSADISLVPGLSSTALSFLKSLGINTINDLKNKELIAVSENPENWVITSEMIKAIPKIENNKATFVIPLDKSKLEILIPVVIDYEFNPESEVTKINKVIYSINNSITEWEIDDDEGMDLPPEFLTNGVILFGVDYIIFNKFVKNNENLTRIKSYDLVHIIEQTVHYPFYGLELDIIAKQINSENYSPEHLNKYHKTNITRAAERLAALIKVIKWLSESLE